MTACWAQQKSTKAWLIAMARFDGAEKKNTSWIFEHLSWVGLDDLNEYILYIYIHIYIHIGYFVGNIYIYIIYICIIYIYIYASLPYPIIYIYIYIHTPNTLLNK